MSSKVSKDARRASTKNASRSDGNGKGKEGVQTKGKQTEPEKITRGGDSDKIAKSTGVPKRRIDELIGSRKSAFQRKVKDRVDTQLKAITAERVLGPSRPYGLPSAMAGKRMHIWELVFGQVNDLQSIVNLREVCVMFNELLKRKYIETMLPQVWWSYFENHGTRASAEYKDWMKTLIGMRRLSKTSKNSVDSLFERGVIGVDGTEWFSMNEPHYFLNKVVPFLIVSASIPPEQQELAIDVDELIDPNEIFPWSALRICELRTLDFALARDSFKIVCENLGANLTSLLYRTEDKSFEAYANLRRWIAFMPNLKDLIVELRGPTRLRSWEITGKIKVKPFPTCRSLKRYGEGPEGFGVPFFVEIIRANPTIQEVLLGETEFREWEIIKNALDTLKLTKVHITSIPDLAFFDDPFQKPLQLTTLAVWNPAEDVCDDDGEISSKQLFKFISSCTNLVDLMVSMPYISDKGRYLKLPRLKYLTWKVFPTFKSFKFLKHAEDLQYLDLDMSVCPDTREKDEVMEFLGEWNIPLLFPALRSIRIRTQQNGPFKEIWTRGSA